MVVHNNDRVADGENEAGAEEGNGWARGARQDEHKGKCHAHRRRRMTAGEGGRSDLTVTEDRLVALMFERLLEELGGEVRSSDQHEGANNLTPPPATQSEQASKGHECQLRQRIAEVHEEVGDPAERGSLICRAPIEDAGVEVPERLALIGEKGLS